MIKFRFVTYDREDVDENWIDRTRLDISGKNWSLSIDPYLNNHWEPWLMTMKGYNEWRDVDYFLLNIGWLLGWMFDFDKKREGTWDNWE